MEHELEEYFCIYLDILGYSNRIKYLNENELKIELNNFIEGVMTENEFLDKLSNIIQYKIKLFSDNIFIALPVTKETINDFHLVLGHIIDYQKSLIQGGYFIRGGITKGILYIDDQIIWGPALIEAVELEKEMEYPVIGISSDVIELFRENDLFSSDNELLCVPIIEIKEDKYFLDYLQTTIHLTSGKPVTYYTFIQAHQGIVRHNLLSSKDRIYDKYNMLANYHNEFCNYYKEMFPQIMYFTIKEYHNVGIAFKRKYLKMLI